ncbi:hypothetical protein [Thermomonospora umbrina]|uniref:Uncharacterized protein n=1 Tax=Thermomonospora umbrina TaxID=111806 RepID=A0A3D9T227_9ACTN|nr:hypothetical protein [Thermomonospora umbrina]REE97891.1 hypothetical protein DFJ69_3367 [Thermomonospora umbrina]
MKMPLSRHLGVLGLMSVLTAGNCEPDSERFWVINNTGDEIVIDYTRMRTPTDRRSIETPSGTSHLIHLMSECEKGLTVMVGTTSGRMIAKLDSTICDGKSWVIEPGGRTRLVDGFVQPRRSP